MRRAARTDANQPEIVKAFRACGAYVEPMHAVGRGFPDLVVLHRGRVLLVEVKDGAKPPSARRLTEDQADWHLIAAGHGVTVHVVETVEDVLKIMGAT